MRIRLAMMLVLALAVFGECAGAAAVPQDSAGDAEATVTAPQWKAGSRWEYSDGYGLSVAAANGGDTVFERLDAKGQWFSMRGFLRQDAASATARRQTIYRTVPPGAGGTLSSLAPLTFQREYLSNGQLIVHATSWTVEGRQRITVPAGTFDCWVIVWRARSLKSNWTGFERWWYSPEAQLYVRLEYKYGPMETASRVLMRYSLPDSEAVGTDPSDSAWTPRAAAMNPIPLAPFALGPIAAPALTEAAVEKAKPEPALEIHTVAFSPDSLAAPGEVRDPPVSWAGAKADGQWVVQIASQQDRSKAGNFLAETTMERATLLAGLPSGIEEAEPRDRGVSYRVWVGGYDTSAPAKSLCQELKTAGIDCFVRRRDPSIALPLRRH